MADRSPISLIHLVRKSEINLGTMRQTVPGKKAQHYDNYYEEQTWQSVVYLH